MVTAKKPSRLVWPVTKDRLLELGKSLVLEFCKHNKLPNPTITEVNRTDWLFPSVCAYYDKSMDIKICTKICQRPCSDNEDDPVWSWPCHISDREPLGVLAHELGHHCDVLMGIKLKLFTTRYRSEYSVRVHKESGEGPITSYCPNHGEWFAEIFRLFVTNPSILKILRPKAYNILLRDFKPSVDLSWKKRLGVNVPDKILRTLSNKGVK